MDQDTQTAVGFDEKYRTDNTSKTELFIDALPLGRTYAFLLLMGYREQEYAQPGYVYKGDKNPALMLAGLESGVKITKDQTAVRITMNPLQVDTTFTHKDDGMPIHPVIGSNGHPRTVILSQGSWNAKWTVTGLDDLIKAQKIINASAGNELRIQKKAAILNGSESSVEPADTNGVITLNIPQTDGSGGR